jgi:DNA-binding transcriptional ArsR family regulator
MKKKTGAMNRAELGAMFFKGFSDPTRLSILEYLSEGERSVNDIASHLGMRQSCVSNHLACMRHCHFVTARQEGRKVYYSVQHPDIRSILKLGERIVKQHALELARCTNQIK